MRLRAGSLPGWVGLEALARVCRRAGAPPVILLTAFGDEATHHRALEIGVLVLIDKPFDIDDLRVAVANALAARPRRLDDRDRQDR